MTNNVTVNKNFLVWNDVASNNQRYTQKSNATSKSTILWKKNKETFAKY